MKKLLSVFLAVIMVAAMFAGSVVTSAASLKSGDVDGDGKLTNKDVILLFRHVSGKKLENFHEEVADVDGDGKVNNKDVIRLFKKVSTISTEPEIELKDAAFDWIRYDDNYLVESKAYMWVADEANRAALDFDEGAVKEISFRGWAFINTEIKGFAYSIDGGELVSGAFIEDRAEELAKAGFAGAQGYIVTVPVAELEAGDHTIAIYVTDTNNDSVAIVKVKEGVTYPVAITFTVKGETPVDFFDDFGENHNADDWAMAGAPKTDGQLSLGDPTGTDWVGAGFLAVVKPGVVDYTQKLVIEFEASAASFCSAYTGFGLRGNNYTDENGNAAMANWQNGGRWGQPSATETASGIILDLKVVGAAGLMGLTFADSRTLDGQDNDTKIFWANKEGFNVEETHKYKIVDEHDVITMYIDGELLVKIELSDLRDGYYNKATTTDRTGRVNTDMNVTVAETGYFGFFQRAAGITVDNVSIKTYNPEENLPELQIVNCAYDVLKYDDTELVSEKAYIWANDKTTADQRNFVKGTVKTISLKGWALVTEGVNIKGFGYKLDGGETVKGAFIDDRAQELAEAGFPGAQGFLVSVDVSELDVGSHKIVIYAIDEYDREVKVVKVKGDKEYVVRDKFNVLEPAAQPTAKLFLGETEQKAEVASKYATFSADGDNLVVTTTNPNDPWFEVVLPEIDTTVYTSFVIRYRATSVHNNNIYLRDTTKNSAYSGTTGTWAMPNMTGDSKWHNRTLTIAADYGFMAGTKLTGIRIPIASTEGGTLEIEYIKFYTADNPAPPSVAMDSLDHVTANGVRQDDKKVNGNYSTIQIFGWAFLTGQTPIYNFGYKIDNNEAVELQNSAIYDDTLFTPLGVVDPGHTVRRYRIDIDISGLEAGTHTVNLVVFTESGQAIEDDSANFPLTITITR